MKTTAYSFGLAAAFGLAATVYAEPAKRTFPPHITAHDFMTAEDVFYHQYLNPLCKGDNLEQWPIVKQIVSLGEDLIDARVLAHHMHGAVFVNDQDRAEAIVNIVKECAQVLNMNPPEVLIKADPRFNAYVTRLQSPHHLVITSGLLDLYKDSPEELRFVLGHELGHLKAQHIRCHMLGRALIHVLMGKVAEIEGSFTRQFVAGFMITRLLGWYRASEMSADRAGFMCVGGDLRTSAQALFRLKHGIKEDNPLFDNGKEWNPFKDMLKQRELETEPFVKIVHLIQSSGQTHPFINERVGAVASWNESGQWERLQARPQREMAKKTLVIKSIEVLNLPNSDEGFREMVKSDPFARILYDGKAKKTQTYTNNNNPRWPNIDIPFPYVENAKLIVEVQDEDYVTGNDLIGAVILPVEDTAVAKTVSADLRLDLQGKSTIVNRPLVKVTYIVKPE